ncbi:MAG: endonuclease [Candidatus Izimaplasma sp.]|nr:endonuclease [Candidatus Izimaplasma bacterium]
MKKVFKISFITISILLFFIVGFVFTLHIFEFTPEEIKTIAIENNQDNSSENYVELNSEISILTFNTGYASLSETEDFVMDGGNNTRMSSKEEVEVNIDGIKTILTRESVDIYLLQEIDTDSKRSYEINQHEIYKDLLNYNSAFAYNFRAIFVPFPVNPTKMIGKVNSGIATYSNFYVEESNRIQLPGSFPWPVRLANLKRALLINRYPIVSTDKELVVINLHLSAYDDGSMRVQEMEKLKEVMLEEKNKGNYVIAGGDFNQSFQEVYSEYNDTNDYTYKELYELKDSDYWEAYPLESDWFYENEFLFGIDSTTPTCRLLNEPLDTDNMGNNQYYLIDGFIVSDNVTILSVETLDEEFKYSDHNPVKLIVKLNN